MVREGGKTGDIGAWNSRGCSHKVLGGFPVTVFA